MEKSKFKNEIDLLFDNLEHDDYFDTISTDYSRRTKDFLELFNEGFSKDSYTDSLIDVDEELLDILSKVFFNIRETHKLSPSERDEYINTLTNESDKYFSSYSIGLIQTSIRKESEAAMSSKYFDIETVNTSQKNI